ncbi:ATP-grasp domain-containing protein [Bacillus sp. 31A1R]|uniref:ATP-grasp domain-containing protein n=1 Tax=Robertmurraya mangrovi TaxID=3098077 RepID=A0ABU5J0Q3_9BACI|nr:ATP-grasp domain-containing protein [Bacillus sp. 31A1R]MDZ5472993.1 ATP-grasp domain-containing protein [Bacillus sp. 31A1R]
MKTIVFIGTNKSGSSREAIKAAEQLGYFTVVFTNREKQLEQRQQYPDIHELVYIDIENITEMRKEIKKLQFQGKEILAILSFVDSSVHTASTLSDEFCHNYASTEAIFKMENKQETRLALENESYTPKFHILSPGKTISINEIPNLDFPVMVKSPKSTGSKDALLAENKKQLEKNLVKLQEKYPKDLLIIEEYIDGDQYLVEALIHNGKIHIAGVLEQEITKGKRFIVTGYGVLAEVPDKLEKEINQVLQSIVTRLNLHNGALHLEMRRSKNGWKLIEINPRISGGAMNKMLQAAFGFNLVEETIKLYLGEEPYLHRKTNNFVFTQHLIVSNKGILEKVTGRNRATHSPGVVEVYVKPKKGTLLTPPLSMGHRYAYVIAKGNSMEEAKQLAKTAANEIKFHMVEEY